MNRLALFFVAAWLGAPACAQTVYSPGPVYQTTEGGSFAFYFGAHSNERIHLADGNLRNRVTLVTSLNYRLDNRIYNVTSGLGRSFYNVTLQLSDCSLASLSTTMSLNATSTPTLAFSGSVTWPTISGQQTSNGWPMTFPCNPWVSSGTADLLANFRFYGGTLADNSTWFPATPRPYYLDGYKVGGANYANMRSVWNGSSACIDSGQGIPSYTPYVYLAMKSYGSSSGNYFEFSMASYYTAALAPVLHLVDFGGGAPGTPYPGVGCANLYVAASPVMTIWPMVTRATKSFSGYTYLGFPGGKIPFDKAAAGLQLYGQAAWTDSKTSALKLSIGGQITIPALPRFPTADAAKRVCVIRPAPGMPARLVNFAYYSPITRYN